MLEKDKRALTRITSKVDATERNSISSVVSDTKSENEDVLPQQDSPSLPRKSTEEELWLIHVILNCFNGCVSQGVVGSNPTRLGGEL